MKIFVRGWTRRAVCYALDGCESLKEKRERIRRYNARIRRAVQAKAFEAGDPEVQYNYDALLLINHGELQEAYIGNAMWAYWVVDAVEHPITRRYLPVSWTCLYF